MNTCNAGPLSMMGVNISTSLISCSTSVTLTMAREELHCIESVLDIFFSEHLRLARMTTRSLAI